MTVHRPANTPKSMALLWTLLVLVCAGGFWNTAKAECANYESYLHWIASLEIAANPNDFAIQGSYAYIIDGSSPPFLQVVDISDPANPTIVGSCEVPGATAQIAVSGAKAVITAGWYIYRVDISDPTNPSWSGIQALYPSTDLVLSGNIAYSSSIGIDSRVLVEDISRSPNDWQVGQIHNLSPVEMTLEGNFIYMACVSSPWGCDAGLQVVDVTNLTSPSVVGSYSDNSLTPSDIAVSGDLAYLACGSSGMVILDVSTPGSPQYVSTFNPDGCADYVTAEGDYCYLSCSDLGLTYVVDITDPELPVQVGGITPFGQSAGVHVAGSHLYMTIEGFGMDIIAVASPGGLDPIRAVDTPGTAENVISSTTRSDLLFVADGDAGLQVIDISIPLEPVIIGFVDTPGYAKDLAILGTTVFVADSDEGIQAVDVSTPSTPSIIGAYDTPGSAVDIALTPTHAYVADASNGVQVIDIQNPANMSSVGVQDSLTASTGIDISGPICFVADATAGLTMLHADDPSNPWIIDGAKIRAITEAVDVSVAGDRAFVAVADSSIYVVDVTDPSSPQELGILRTNDQVSDLAIVGDHVYLANSAFGMQLVDVQESDNPIVVGNVNVASISRGVSVTEDFAFVAADTAGVMICPSQCGAYERVTADFSADTTTAFLPATIAFTNESLGYILDYAWDFGDGIGYSTEVNPSYTFVERGEYSVKLTVTGLAFSDSLTSIIYVMSEPPLVTDISDVPDDQGGYVYVNFAHSGYDDTSPGRSEMYTVQRQDDGQWVTVATSGAYGELYYSVLANTQGDGVEDWMTAFRVIAHMDEGNWIGPTFMGYSEDNIAPGAPANLVWVAQGHLGWDQVDAQDFAYYRIYGSMQPNLDNAESLATTIETEFVLGEIDYPWVLVVAVDDYDLESEPSIPLVVTATGESVAKLMLGRAVPNPFNPSTTISFALPEPGRTRLSVYDVNGSLVRVLVDETVVAGHHQVTWHGRNEAGHAVASGIYLYRLEANGVELTEQMVLIK